MSPLKKIEKERLALQIGLDLEKSQLARNKLGQFATPTVLANDILAYAAQLLPNTPVKFIDPAIGTGAFYSALLEQFDQSRIDTAVGYEIDRDHARASKDLWSNYGLTYRQGDFTIQEPDQLYNLLICNPPYVRHHHISKEDKARLQLQAANITGLRIGGLSGLYCYFLALSQRWLAKGAVSGWLIPSEFMDVNYGKAIKVYLLNNVTLLRIHRFDPTDVQFDDALVSSAVVWFRNEMPTKGSDVEFSFGGSLLKPSHSMSVPTSELQVEPKWSRFPMSAVRSHIGASKLSDYFRIKRGLATGDNKYFIISEAELIDKKLPLECFRPILPSPRYVSEDIIESDQEGVPLLEKRLFLLDTKLSEEEIRASFPTLFAYLQEGKNRKLHEGYLCSHRKPWYSQESRPAPPIVCTYLGRNDKKTGRPFRFIRNRSNATAANVYLALYPTPLLLNASRENPLLLDEVWKSLNEISAEVLLGEGRVYGGGLHKLEPKELANVPVPALANLIPLDNSQVELFRKVSAA